MDDHPMQKLHRINKEKDFWGGHRKNIRKINCWQSQITPLSRLCGPVCGFRSRSKETTSRSHTSPRWAVFEERLRRRDFSSICGSSKQVRPKCHTQISYIWRVPWPIPKN